MTELAADGVPVSVTCRVLELALPRGEESAMSISRTWTHQGERSSRDARRGLSDDTGEIVHSERPRPLSANQPPTLDDILNGEESFTCVSSGGG
ncbi:hypothetical protein DEA06_10375 [Microbacterium sp. Gd 4-13]|nr:hypothetical protein DEA06_10375 [Microbacterium sp. Gd 4-13]